MVDTKRIVDAMRQLPPLLDAIAAATQVAGASPAVPKYLAVASTLLRLSTKAADELASLTALVTQMTAAGREPSADEWAGLQIRSQIAHAAIQSYDLSAEH